MKVNVSLLLIVIVPGILYGDDTFSIVAVDPVTGQVGSAGASCIAGSIILSDPIPGRGVIQTQAFYHPTNQANARTRLLEGDSPQEVIDWLVANDAQGNPTFRQYAIADFSPIDEPRVAAYTGVNTSDYKGHLLGPNYAVAGNILLGPEILEGMELEFNEERGALARKLMAALQGANVVGADTRCTSRGTSSISAFVRVAGVNDEANSEGSFYLDLNINSTPSGVDPIDELQELFDAWLVDHDGDHNNDGFVDGADFLKWQGGESRNPLSSSDLAEWQANFGAMPSGDFDDDVDVVGADFLYWQLNDGSESSLDHWQATFGDVASSITAASTGVPEPTTGLMLMLGMAALMFRRHLEA